ncbi:MAG: hypothetical protein ABL876_00120 [Chitinophagaceae bacterium]
MAFETFDYDTLIVGDYYEGIDNGRLDEEGNGARDVRFVGRYLGKDDKQILQSLKDPDNRYLRQVYLLMNDDKHGKVWRCFDPETLTHVPEPEEAHIVVDSVAPGE